jgi:tetratricopeptide (TPR) repeat protein
LESALREALQLLATHPAQAAQRAQTILAAVPGQPQALLVLGIARRIGGRLDAALQVLEPLARAQPGFAAASYELGVALGLAGRRQEAIVALRRALQLRPDIGEAWRLLSDHLLALGDVNGAEAAHANFLARSVTDPRLATAVTAVLASRCEDADALLIEHLKQNPTDVLALRLRADVAARLSRSSIAEKILAYCLELAPDFAAARYDYAIALHRLNKPREALAQVEQLLASDTRNAANRSLKAGLLTDIGEHAQADEIHAGLVAEYPDNASFWIRHGHALRMTGESDAAGNAYRRAIQLAPGLGEAWWALANMKTVRLTADDVVVIRQQLVRGDLSADDRVQLRFALGKALEDLAQYEESFRQYAEGNRLRRSARAYDAGRTSEHVRRCKELFTPDFFRKRQGWGSNAHDPIFVIGLPRSGSTLVEQILASHSAIEGTRELMDVTALAWSLNAGREDASMRYPELLARLEAAELRALGERYLEHTRVYRKTDRPRFIDKLPNNWEHAGFIHLMLPKARIVDVRRDPMGCGFSCFKQYFAAGQDFTCDLRDIGRYYRDCVDLMAHFDLVLPGRIHRVEYETLVQDTESEVRRLLDYCGLPFEDACLRFHENRRAVHTPSSEQVRAPIYRSTLAQWRHYEPWLAPLREALGPLAR